MPTKKKLNGNTAHETKEELENKVEIIELMIENCNHIETPYWLNDEAKKEWKRLIPLLIESKILTYIDLTTLEKYCQAHGNWMECEKITGKEGYTQDYTNKAGATNVSKHPAVDAGQKYAMLAEKYADKLGLSPKSRGKLDIKQPGKKQSDFLEFIKQRS